MTARAWVYIWLVLGAGTALAAQALTAHAATGSGWASVEILFALAVAAQLFKVEAPNHVLFYASPIFFFAGAILLSPFQLFLLILLPHAVEWVKERWTGTSHLNDWYLQPFNVAMLWMAARGAQVLYLLCRPHVTTGSPGEVAVVLGAAAFYVALNHALLGGALSVARGMSWRESGVLEAPSLINDLILAAVGSVVAVLWLQQPWYIVPALAPLGLMYQALMVPRLKQEAEMDGKTGLYNARRFNEVFESELDRAQRFDRPLAFVMADMDYLREVNNTYGHLAGDAVIAGIGEIIRNTIRDYDVAGRFGGEEYALVLPEVDEEQARQLAERLRTAIEAAEFLHAKGAPPIRATMSLGVACFPDHGSTRGDITKAADAAVYTAKNNGRNQVVCASEVRLESTLLDAPQVNDATHKTAVSVRIEPSVARGAAPVPDRGDQETGAGSWSRMLLIAAVVSAGTGAATAAILHGSTVSPAAVLVLAALAVLAELLEVDLFGRGTVSVAVGIAFTAALSTGVVGLTCVGAMIALVHHLKQRRGLRQAHRAAFNWAVHVLAGLAIAIVVATQRLPLTAKDLPLLVPIVIVAAVAYFAVETGLVATVVALGQGDSPLVTWRTHFRWLLPHYVVLCLMGLILSVTLAQFGTLGVVIFALPLLSMHYVQKQSVSQTQENLRALQRLNRDLMRAALHDHLTELGNERGFQEALRAQVEEATRTEVPLVLARLNVDEFKAINEESGRRHGDTVLMEIASLLRRTAGAGRAFRLAADEFAVFLPDLDAARAIQTLDAVRREVPGRLRRVTVSIGVAVLDPGELDPDQLSEQAGEALREAKKRGRNTLVAFDEIRESTLVASSAQAQAVRRLLAESRLSVMFQPIWDIDRGVIFGYEALVRPSAEYGLAGPQEAFDVAARLGRAHDLDDLCRSAILARATELPEEAYLFMNLAPEALEHDRISIHGLLAACTQAGVPPQKIVLEITERSVIRPEVLAKQAQRLRQAGFKLALDDTGAGNAGLSVLSQLHVDFVKVDRGVVSSAESDRAARAVLAGIFALAHEMGATVIAEGIETIEMLEMVIDMSRHLDSAGSLGRGVQGFLLGRPGETVVTSEEALRAGSLEGARDVWERVGTELVRVRRLDVSPRRAS